VIKWLAHLVIIGATLATAFDVIPLNKILFLLGCMLWMWVGILWKQPSIWTLNLFCGILYLIGMI
jgi:hypothetical protein